MITNIVQAVFCGSRAAVTKPLTQGDYGQAIEFVGIELPAAFTVYFSNERAAGTAKAQTGRDGVVEIPNEYLQTGLPVYGWVFLHAGENDGRTEYTVTTPVTPSPEHTDEEPTPVQESRIETAIAALNAGVEAAEDAAGSVQNMGVDAQTLAPGSEATVNKTVDPDTGAVTLEFGIPRGDTGPDGDDGYSPTVTVTDITGGHRVTITDATGAHSFDVMDGQSGGGAVESVNGKTGAVTLDAGDIGYDDQETYDAGSVGAELGDLKTEIGDKLDAPATAGTSGQVLTSDGQGGQSWETPSGGDVTDVQVNGVSVVSGGVAAIPIAGSSTLGVIKPDNDGLTVQEFAGSYRLCLVASSDNYYKGGNASNRGVVASKQHISTFYGLAKAAGADMASISSTTVGVYPEEQKSAISQMLNGSVAVTGTTPSITALPGIRYVCGECTTLDITLPASGCVDVVFESGATATVLTIIPPTGQTVRWTNGFDPTALEADTTYEINIADGLGVAGQWT